jgi:hypothetical protein
MRVLLSTCSNQARQKPRRARKAWFRWPSHSLNRSHSRLMHSIKPYACSYLVRVSSAGPGWGPRRMTFRSLVLVPLRRREVVSPLSRCSSWADTRSCSGPSNFPTRGQWYFIPFHRAGVVRDASCP